MQCMCSFLSITTFCLLPAVCVMCAAGTTIEANLLFGRGMLAGIDRREQKKQAAAVEADMLRKLREGAGISETAAMRQEEQDRRDRADKYGAGDMKVRVALLCWWWWFGLAGQTCSEQDLIGSSNSHGQTTSRPNPCGWRTTQKQHCLYLWLLHFVDVSQQALCCCWLVFARWTHTGATSRCTK